jgi:hypothetical protein
VLVGIEIAPEVLGDLPAGLVAGGGVAAAEQRADAGLDHVPAGPAVALAPVGEFVVDNRNPAAMWWFSRRTAADSWSCFSLYWTIAWVCR